MIENIEHIHKVDELSYFLKMFPGSLGVVSTEPCTGLAGPWELFKSRLELLTETENGQL